MGGLNNPIEIFFRSNGLMYLKQCLEIFRSVVKPGKISKNIGPIKTSFDIVQRQLLGGMTDFVQECRIGQHQMIIRRSDETDDKRTVVVFSLCG